MRYLIFLLLLFCGLTAQTQQLYFANYTLDDGLPHSRINSLIQDKQGYIWIGTSMGVSKFDGHVFKNYTIKDGLGDNKVTAIYETGEGIILFGHENGSISYWNKNKFESSLLEKDTKRIFCIYPDKNGNVWFGTQGSGAIKVNGKDLLENIKNKKYERFDNTKGLTRDVTSVLHDYENRMWFVTDLGIKLLNNVTKEFEFYLPKGVEFVQFSSIVEDGNNDIWLGTVTSGAFKYSKELKKFIAFNSENEKLQSNFVTTLKKNSQGNIMIGTWGGGFAISNKKEDFTTINEINGLSENKVRCLLEDREGNIWVGTNQNGLSCYRGNQFKAFLKSKIATNTPIGAVLKDSKGRLWCGSNNGIYLSENKSLTDFRKIDFLTNGEEIEVTSIIEDKSGTIWVSTWGAGILLIHPQNYTVDRFQGKIPLLDIPTFNEQYVHTLKKDSKGKIWISMLRGLAVFNPKENSIKTFTKRDGLADISNTDIQEDNLGKIWIGSASSGLTIYDKEKFTVLKNTNIPINPAISSISKSPNGTIWIATEGGGIYSFNNNNFTNYTILDGLSSNFITLIECDSNNRIWLGTNKGICQFDPSKKKSIVYNKIDKNSRIETKPNASFLDENGTIFFGTINGVLQFNTAQFKTNPVESITKLYAVKVFQDTIFADNTKLNYKKNYLSFYFNGICFSDPEKVFYQYKLEGFDDTWQTPTQLNFATYNNLNPGNYRFLVKSCNNDGIWNKTPLTFSFEITPPFWMTWWFYTISAVILIIIIVAFVKFRERNLRLEKRRLEDLIGERTTEVVKQKEEIVNQRDELRINSNIIEQKNLAITDSIRYAKRIQLATLPYSDIIKKHLPDSFILYKPKDIVSGDFYAFAKKEDEIILAAADCTGHGVPGAFMSMIGTNLFNQIINEKNITKPSEILNQLDKGIERALKQEETDNHDGMDMVICSFNFKENKFQYAGANRPLWIVRKNKHDSNAVLEKDNFGEFIEIIKPNKNPIGGFNQEQKELFTNHYFEIETGDTIYLLTDGYSDQFGGALGKKLLSKRLRDYLIEIKNESMQKQEMLLDLFFEEWRGKHEQVDDVLIIGIRL